jgi:type I restriction enzyme S subunit
LLDRSDALQDKRSETIFQLDRLVQSIFYEMFGDPTSRRGSWNISNFRNLVSEFRYGTSNKSQPQGAPALRIPNVANSEIDTSDLKLVPVSSSEYERLRLLEGDLLFVRTNGNPNLVGRCAIYNRDVAAKSGRPGEDFIYASYLIRARPKMDVVSPVYLREFMLGPAGRRALRSRSKTSAGQFNINTESLGAIEVPVPPLGLQQEYVRRVEAVAKLKNNHRTYLAELGALSASLQYRAFQGEL